MASPRFQLSRGEATVAGALLLVFVAALVAAALGLRPTSDERAYLTLGRLAVREELPFSRGSLHPQGLLPLYAAQTWISRVSDQALLDLEDGVLEWGRLGMLPFGLLGALAVFLWSREAFGVRAALLSLSLYCLHPLMSGYGAQITVDMAHAAFICWVGYFLWRYSMRKRARDLACVGLSLGLALSCKYSALLPAVPIAILVAVAAGRAAGSLPRAAGRGALALVLLLVLSLVVLHASYLFEAKFAPTGMEEYRSPLFHLVLSVPGLGSLVGLLPEPFARGLDVQFLRGHANFNIFLHGSFADGHWDYYFWSMLLKTPLWMLAAGLLAVLLRGPRVLAGRVERPERLCLTVVAILVVPTFLYLSLGTTFQTGVRFAIFLFPLLFVACGALLHHPRIASFAEGRRAAPAFGVLVLVALPSLASMPNQLAYFNPLFGGQAGAYRWFEDSNCDWGQMHVVGLDELREREPDLEELSGDQGPRFGHVAIYLTELVHRDPENPPVSRSWLDPFEPVAHVDAAWWLFEVTPQDFERAVERTADVRVRAELVVAYLGAGKLEAARRHLDRLPKERAAPLWELLDLIERGPGELAQPSVAMSLAQSWRRVGRPRLALEALEPLLDSTDPMVLRLRVRYLLDLRERDRALELVTRPGAVEADPGLAYVITKLFNREWRFQESLDLLARFESELRASDPDLYERRVANTRELLDQMESHRMLTIRQFP